MKLTSTHTYATLEVSDDVYNEIAQKLFDAGYTHVLNDGAIDMAGIALVRERNISDYIKEKSNARKN